MRRKYFTAALALGLCLTVSQAPAVFAEETTEAVTEAESEGQTGTAEEEEQTEAGASAEEETETETEMERPDYSALDYVTLGEYKGLTVVLSSTEITEEDVEQQAKENVLDSGLVDMETITEGTVQDGDTAVIDFEGKKDGVAFDGGTSKDYELEIGSGSFIDGFEDGLIGVAVGETVDLNLTFPENYYSEDLAGQEVVFTVTVNEIQRLPELTDEIISEATEGEYTSLEAYLTYVRNLLEEDAEYTRQSNIDQELYTQVYNNSTISGYPQEMVDYSTNQAVSYYKMVAEAYSMEYEDLIALYGYTEEEFNEALDQMVKSTLEQEMLLRAIAEQEGLEVTDEEYETGAAEYAAQYGYDDTDEFVEDYGGESSVRLSLLLDKVFVLLEESAVIEEETETAEAAETAEESETAEAAETADETEAAETEETTDEAVTEAAETADETETEA